MAQHFETLDLSILYLFILEYRVAHVSLQTVFETGSDFRKMNTRARIFKQGSWRLGESRILPFATPTS